MNFKSTDGILCIFSDEPCKGCGNKYLKLFGSDDSEYCANCQPEEENDKFKNSNSNIN